MIYVKKRLSKLVISLIISVATVLPTMCSGQDENFIPFVAMQPSDIWADQLPVAELAEAAGSGQLSKIDRLVADGVELNAKGAHGATPLWWPLQKTNKRGFVKLLELGADPNISFENGDSIMTWAVQMDDPYFFNKAIQFGGNPHYVDETRNSTLLHFSARAWAYSMEIVESLIESGVNLNLQDYAGATAMQRAVANRRYDIALSILEAGGNPYLKSNGGLDIRDMLERRPPSASSRNSEVDLRAKFVDLLKEKGMEAK